MAVNHNLANTQLRNHKWEDLGITDSNLKQLNTLARQLDYVPLFKAISPILNTLESRDSKRLPNTVSTSTKRHKCLT